MNRSPISLPYVLAICLLCLAAYAGLSGASASAEVTNCITGENPHDFGGRPEGSPKVLYDLELEVSCKPAHAFKLNAPTADEVEGIGNESVLGIQSGGTDTCTGRNFTTQGEKCKVEVFFDPNHLHGSYATILTFQYEAMEEKWLTALFGEIEEINFEAGSSPAKIEGDKVGGGSSFGIDGSTVNCEKVHFATSSEVTLPATSFTVHPEYSGCTAFGFVGATVTTTGCNYVLKAGAETKTDVFAGQVEIECETGKKITIVASTCEATIGPQTFSSGISFEDKTAASPKDVLLSTAATTMKAVKVKDGFLCPFSGTGEISNGAFSGETTVIAKHSGSQVAFSLG